METADANLKYTGKFKAVMFFVIRRTAALTADVLLRKAFPKRA